MEIWELRKSLFSEVNFLLKCLKLLSLLWWRRVQKKVLKRAEGSSASTSAGRSPPGVKRGENPKARREAESVTELQFRKAIFVASAFCLRKCATLFLRGWRRLKLVVMRPTECGERGELRALRIDFFLFFRSQQRSNRHKRMQRGRHSNQQPCWV